MKHWQLMAVLSFEKPIIDKYFSSKDYDGKSDVDNNILIAALKESKLQYYVTSDNYLRLMPEAEYLKEQGIQTIEVLPVLDAYNKFGADAITEVIDYASYNLSK